MNSREIAAERYTAGLGYPDGWLDTTLGSVAEINSESLGTQTPAAFQFRYIDIASVTSGMIDWSSVKAHQFAMAPSRARRIVRPGDVLLSTVRPGLQAHAYADWDQQDGYICSTGFAVLRGGRAIWPRFLYHLVFSDIITSQVRRLEVGSNYPAITETDVRWLRILQPPLPEQRRIAEILDTADRTIGETEALISKLKHMKTGLMHDLLTRGLDERGQLRDPDAHPEQFKDSPLGRIPREWEIRNCRSLCREIVVGIVIRPSQYYEESGVPILRSANVRETGLDPSDLVFMSERSNRMLAKSMVRAGDVVTVRTGYPGTSCVVPDEFDGANCVDIIISRLGPEVDPSFLSVWINSDFGKGQVLRAQGGLAQQHFNVGELQKLLVAKPPIKEQHRIAEILDAHDARIRAEEAYRDKLKLQKKGLMEDLLTGRVRVKTAQEVSA